MWPGNEAGSCPVIAIRLALDLRLGRVMCRRHGAGLSRHCDICTNPYALERHGTSRMPGCQSTVQAQLDSRLYCDVKFSIRRP